MSDGPIVDASEMYAVEMKNATTNATYGNTFDPQDEADFEIKILAAAGIETKIENYGSKLTQRRHYSEANGDEPIDVDVTVENGAGTEDVEETDEEFTESEKAAQVEKIRADEECIKIEKAGQVEKIRADEEFIKIEKAAQVEKKIVEDCEGVLSQRRHFPGTTTSNIFR